MVLIHPPDQHSLQRGKLTEGAFTSRIDRVTCLGSSRNFLKICDIKCNSDAYGEDEGRREGRRNFILFIFGNIAQHEKGRA